MEKARATPEDVQRLAALARISIPDTELEAFAHDFDGILAYVGKLDELTLDIGTPEAPAHRNILRKDGTPHEKGTYTERLVEQFPRKEGNSLAVKQIISYD